MKNKRFEFRSVTSRMASLMTLAGVTMLCAMLLFVSPLFYQLTKNNLATYTSNIVGDCAVRFSYILTQHKSLRQTTSNPAFLHLVESYYSDHADRESITSQLASFLPIASDGKKSGENGALANTNYPLIYTERGDCFYAENTREIAQALVASDSFVHFLTPDLSLSYLPVLPLQFEDTTTHFFVYIHPFSVDGLACYAVNLTPFDDIRRQLSLLEKNNIDDFQIICKEQILFSNLESSAIDLSAYPPEAFDKRQLSVAQVEHTDGFNFLVLCSFSAEQLYLATHVSSDSIMLPYRPFFTALEVLMIVIIGVLVATSCIIVHLTLKRLTRLRGAMEHIQAGHYDIPLTDHSADEIGTIIRTTNKMLAQIRTDTEQKLMHEKNEKKMQYTLLVSAIDPHFIYNTLDVVTFLAAMGRNEDVIAVNTALIDTLKDRLSIKTYKVFDSVSVEKHVVEKYMVIQKYLCHNPIQFDFHAETQDLQAQIPKNIIQPLVENAIKHGILTHKGENRLETIAGIIRVCVSRQNGRITITVSDNGTGMDEALRQRYTQDAEALSLSSEHIGISNVKMRLYYLYQNDFTFDIHSAPGEGTTIIIDLPERPIS